MDPNVAKLIERSRARRGDLKDFSSDRSPLPSEKKTERSERDRSPLKQINAARASSPRKSTPQSPLKSPVRKIEIEVEDSPSNTIRRILSRESLETNVRELIARDSPGKSVVTRVTSSKVESPNKTTYTKTVITEKEEKYEKKTEISYSGNKEVLDTIKEKFDNLEKDSEKSKTYDSDTFTKNQVSSPTKRESSPTKFKPRVRQFSPSKAAPAPSPPKSATKPASSSNEAGLDDWESGRKARLASLASKFRTYDEDEPPVQREVQLPKAVTKPAPRAPSPSKHAPVSTPHIRSRSPVKASPHLNPNQFISPQVTKSPTKPGDNLRSVRFVSPTKTPVLPTSPRKEPGEASFVSSLKAQGFQETDSKSKLVYKFDQQDPKPEEVKLPRSPVKTSKFAKTEEPSKERDRSVSPVRANPFLARDKQEARQERGRSPTKKTVGPPQPRSYSPEKLHPLQFVTPGLSQGPPKPSRTYESQAATARVMETERVDSPAMLSVTKKREMFEAGAQLTPEAEKPDPAMMSISQRKALFERNKSVPTPIARFGESVTPAMLAKAKPSDTPSMTPAEAWKRKRPVSPVKQDLILSAVRHESSRRSPSKPSLATPKVPQPQEVAQVTEEAGTPLIGRKTGEMQKKLFQANNSDWRANDIAKRAAEEKKSEMSLLMNRYNHLRKQSEETNNEPKSVSPVKEEATYYPGVNSMKRVRMSPPKPGSLYPSVDFESGSDRPESAMSTDTLNSSYESCVTKTSEAPSLGKDIVAAARIGAGLLQDQELSTIKEDNNDSMDTDDGDVMTDSIIGAEIDDMIDEAIDEDDDIPTPPKVPKMSSSSSGSDGMGRSESTTSWEFHTPQPTRKHHPGRQTKYQTPLITTSAASPQQQQVSIEGEDGPLLHTVSFYRKQKPPNTPVQRIVLNPSLETHSEVISSPRATITQKIHKLQEEAASQLPVIQQASSAVNLCRSTNEFFGSSEQVEGERLLLVATHKRQTATTEIQRLKTEGGLGRDPNRDNSVRGTVSLCGINLGLKSEFVNLVRSGEAGEFIHYFLCLVKCAGQCIPTQMVSSSDGLDGCELHFPNLINFRDLDKDFSIQLEVYGLQTKKEHMPHDAKYHIKKGKSALSALTPKLKMSKTESRLARPNVSSPGGPHTVRTSSFAMVNFTLKLGLFCSTGKYISRLETRSSPSTV